MERFHLITAKFLQIMKILIPDLKTEALFFCTKVQEPTIEDWGKLIILLFFLKDKNNYQRILGMGYFKRLETWIDASRVVHPNIIGHNGGAMSFGWSSFIENLPSII